MVLRIEDTDRERSTPENVDQILEALRWLELDWDEGPLSQWERRERHAEAVDRLLASGHAYEDEGAVRFRVPDEGEITFQDAILGPVTNPLAAIQDFVIRRSDGSPLYNLAVAVDDRDMGITHVVRGQDHVSNTPRQLMLLRGAGRAAAGLRAHPAAARPGRQEALQAPRRGLGAGAARRRLPPRGGAQLHRAARLGLRREHHVHDDRRAGGALRARARVEEPGRVRRAEAALDERPLPARARSGRAEGPARGAAGTRAAGGGRGHQPGEDLHAGGVLGPRRLPGGAAGVRREGVGKGHERRGRRAPAGRPRRARPSSSASTPRRSRPRCAAWSSGWP